MSQNDPQNGRQNDDSPQTFAPYIAELQRQGKREATRKHYLDDLNWNAE